MDSKLAILFVLVLNLVSLVSAFPPNIFEAYMTLDDYEKSATGVKASFHFHVSAAADKAIITFPANFDLTACGAAHIGGQNLAIPGPFVMGPDLVTISSAPCVKNPTASQDATDQFDIKTQDNPAVDVQLSDGPFDSVPIFDSVGTSLTNTLDNNVAGATSKLNVSYTLGSTLPESVIFYVYVTGFDLNNVSPQAFSANAPGNLEVSVKANTIIQVIRTGGLAMNAGDGFDLVISGLKNRESAGATGVARLQIVDDTLTPIESEVSTTPLSLVADQLDRTWATVLNPSAAATTKIIVTFVPSNPIPADGKIEITLPAPYNVATMPGNVGCALLGGGSALGTVGATAAEAGNALTCTRQDDGDVYFSVLTMELTNILNPIAGPTADFIFRTKTNGGALIDVDTTVPPALISTGQLPCALSMSSVFTGETSDWTFGCTLNTNLPADGKIVLRVDPGFDTSGTITAHSVDLDGTLTVTVAHPVITITRAGGTVFTAAPGLDFVISGIVNPVKEQNTRSLGVATFSAADAVLDAGVLPPVEIYKGSMQSASVTFSSDIPSEYVTATIKFALANPPPVGGTVAVKLKDFDIAGAVLVDFFPFTGGFPAINPTGESIELLTGPLAIGEEFTVIIEDIRNPGFAGTHTVNVVTQYINPLGEKLTLDAEPTPISHVTKIGPLEFAEVYLAQKTKNINADHEFFAYTEAPFANNGVAKITFPDQYPSGGGLGVTGCEVIGPMTGTMTHSVNGRTVTCTRTGGNLVEADWVGITIKGVKNPPAATFTGRFSMSIHPAGGTKTIAQDLGIPGIIIREDALATPSVLSVTSSDTAVPANTTLEFGVNTDLSNTGSLHLQAPEGYDLSPLTTADIYVSGPIDGTFVSFINTTTREIEIVRQGDGATWTNADGVIEVMVAGAINGYFVDPTGTNWCIWTSDGGAILDAQCKVTGPPLNTGVVNANFKWVDPEADTRVPLLVEITTENVIPSRAKIILDMGSTRDGGAPPMTLTGMKLGGISGLDGGFTSKVDGETFVISRDGTGTPLPPNTKFVIDIWNLGTPPPFGDPEGRLFVATIKTFLNKMIGESVPSLGPVFLISPANMIHGPAHGTVKKSSIRVKSIDLGTVAFKYAEIQVEFEEDIYINGQSLGSYTGLNPLTRVPKLSDAAKGSSALWCKWGQGFRAINVLINTWPDLTSGEANIRKTQKPPIDSLIVAPPLGEPVFGILPSFGGSRPKGEVENNKRYNLFLLMSETKAFANPVQWFSESDLQDCTLVIPGGKEGQTYADVPFGPDGGKFPVADAPATPGTAPKQLTTADGRPINAQVRFTEFTSRDCDYDKFLILNEKVNDAITKLQAATQGVQAKNYRTLLAALLSSDTAVDCQAFVNQYIGAADTRTVTVPGAVGCFSAPGSPEWTADPCCNQILQFTMCCGEKTVDIEYTAVSSINEEKLLLHCQHPEDIVSLLQDYNGFKQAIEHPAFGCTATRRKAAPDSKWDTLKKFFTSCESEVFGSDRSGKTCKTNADCLTENCQNKKCVVPWDNPEKYLVQCFVRDMDPLLQRFLRDKWGLDPSATTDEFMTTLRAQVSSEECIGPESGNYRAKKELVFNDNGEWIESFTQADTSNCEGKKSCNWDPAQKTEETCTHPAWGSHFCQVCFSEQDCVTIPANDQATCEAGICDDFFTPVGTCGTASGFCDAQCVNGTTGEILECSSESECTAVGQCSDYDMVNYDNPDNPFEVCLIPTKADEFGVPWDCYDLAIENGDSYYNYAEIGCIDPTKLNRADCENAGGDRIWVQKATNQTACEEGYPKRCWDENLFLFNGKDEAACLECGQTMKSIYSWSNANWFSSTVLPGTWTQREFKAVNRLVSTVNMGQLEKVIDNAIASLLGVFYTTEALCKNKLRELEERVVCDCSTGSENRVNCTQGYVSPSVGGGTFFKEFAQSMALGSATITTNQVLSGGANSGFSASVKQFTAAQYAKQGDGYVADATAARRRDRMRLLRRPSLNKNDFSVVQDASGNIVGQLIGDGAQLELTGTGALDVCLEPRGDITADPAYTIAGLAGANSDGSIGSPLSLSVSQKSDRSICATLSASGTYFPIMLLSSATSGGTTGSSNTTTTVSTYTVTIQLRQTLATFNEQVFLAVVASRLTIPLTSVTVLDKKEVVIQSNSTAGRALRRLAIAQAHANNEPAPMPLHPLAVTNETVLEIKLQFTDNDVMTAQVAGETFIKYANDPNDSMTTTLGVIPPSAGGTITGGVTSPTILPGTPAATPPPGGVIRPVDYNLVGAGNTMYSASMVYLVLLCALSLFFL